MEPRSTRVCGYERTAKGGTADGGSTGNRRFAAGVFSGLRGTCFFYLQGAAGTPV